MKNFKKISRENLKTIKAGQEVPSGVYACCAGSQCSSTVTTYLGGNFSCGAGTVLTRVANVSIG
ncbi:bacteriocin-like protein [Chryseobacterium artocarpi]|uniref:bacteriocin-like protein n=1 Tax=Chryseobacterium artocarpi TaxID=1414727 RepID=UPI003F3AB987